MSIHVDPAKLVLPPLIYNGDKRGFLFFWRLVMQTAFAFNFEPILRLPKEDAILAMAIATLPPDFPNKRKQPALEAARKRYNLESPIIALWLEKSVPQTYTDHLLSAPIGDAFATWSIILKKGHPNTKRASRRYYKLFNSLHMRSGDCFEDFVSDMLFSSALRAACNSPVSEQEKLGVLYAGVPAPFFMCRTILECNENTTFDQAVDAFTAVSEDIAHRTKAPIVHTNNNQPKQGSTKKKNNRYEHLTEFCSFCFVATRHKFPHTEQECRRKHGTPTKAPTNFVAGSGFAATDAERTLPAASTPSTPISRPNVDAFHFGISSTLDKSVVTVIDHFTPASSLKPSYNCVRIVSTTILLAVWFLSLMLVDIQSPACAVVASTPIDLESRLVILHPPLDVPIWSASSSFDQQLAFHQLQIDQYSFNTPLTRSAISDHQPSTIHQQPAFRPDSSTFDQQSSAPHQSPIDRYSFNTSLTRSAISDQPIGSAAKVSDQQSPFRPKVSILDQ
jgi:hypothetical protein